MARNDGVHERLVEAAYSLLVAEGPSALTVRRIASDAGMSTMNVYSRFGDKDGVVEQLFLRGYQMLADHFAAAPRFDDPILDLKRTSAELRSFALANVSLYRLMFLGAVPDYVPTPEARALGDAALADIAERFRRCMECGAIRPLDPLQCATMQWGTAHGLISLELSDLGRLAIDWDATFEAAMDNLFRGLRP
jgi:AcrR family transcriptional regulator